MIKSKNFYPELDNYKFWTIEEGNRLKELVGKNLSFDEIGRTIGRSTSSCQNYSHKMGLKNNYRYRKYSYDENFWKIPNLINSYWAGIAAADGCILYKNRHAFSLSLCKSDIVCLEKFKKDCGFTGKITIENRFRKMYEHIGYKIYSTASIRIHGNKWMEDLKNNFNIIPKKSKRLGPPNLNDIVLKLAYFIGYIDGDGTICLTYRKGCNKRELIIRFVSASKSIIEWIKNLTDDLFPKHLYKRRNKDSKITDTDNKYFSYAIAGIKALVVYDYLKDFPVQKMERKWFRKEYLDFLDENKKLFPQYFTKEKLNFDKYLSKKEDLNSHLSLSPVINTEC